MLTPGEDTDAGSGGRRGRQSGPTPLLSYLLEQTIDFATLKDGLHIWCDNAFKQYNLLALLWKMSEHYQIKVSLQFFALIMDSLYVMPTLEVAN
jgi:hypothetical protein